MDSKTTESAASPDRHEHASMTLLRLPDVIHAFAVGTATSDGASVQRQDSDDAVSIDVEHGLATDGADANRMSVPPNRSSHVVSAS
jgi:hypothetical protein